MTQQEKVYEALDKLGIEYKVIHHEAVNTIEEMDATGIFTDGEVCKNLFLRNANGKTGRKYHRKNNAKNASIFTKSIRALKMPGNVVNKGSGRHFEGCNIILCIRCTRNRRKNE